MRPEIKQYIDSLIQVHPIVLFMKGTKERPQCGFSKQVVAVLNSLVGDFTTIDILSDPELREGIKEYSSWPTIPQLYVHQEFVGGCDIVLDLMKNQELHKILKLKKAESPPNITISKKAIEAFIAAYDGDDLPCVRLTIAADFEHGLSFDPKTPKDFSYSFDGLELVVDPFSAFRALGLSIDYVHDSLDAGFVFNNPNEPPLVKELTPKELKTWQDQGKEVLIFDVRPKSEWELAHIASAKLLLEVDPKELTMIHKDHPIVFHCHMGRRSAETAEFFRAKGFTNLYNLTGGIDAWSRTIDQNVPIYEI